MLAISVQAEISEDVWDKIGELMFAVKQQQTEHANLDRVEVQFPPEVISGDGSMVEYYEILPFAPPIVVTLGGTTWLFDDQYCINPECACREAAISFVAETSFAHPDNRRVMARTSFRYAYDEGDAQLSAGALIGVDLLVPSKRRQWAAALTKASGAGNDSLSALSGAQGGATSWSSRHSCSAGPR